MAIERLILIHLNLIELCSVDNTKYLDEDAAEEELLEPILYFYSSQSNKASHYNRHDHHHYNQHQQRCNGLNNKVDASDPLSNEYGYDTKEAIQFSGLCTALFGLPNILTSTDESIGNGSGLLLQTSVVQLTNCILVYQPLETHYNSSKSVKNPSIIAVAQISKQMYQRKEQDTRVYSCSASAVSAAIQQSHALFCLLRGGGIHNRLLNLEIQDKEVAMNSPIRNNNKEIVSSHSYPTYKFDMCRLFELRKKRRKLQRLIEKKQYMIQYNNRYANSNVDSCDIDCSSDDDIDSSTSEDNDEEYDITALTESLVATEHELMELELTVPIRSIRSDLRVHYDTFLAEDRWYRNCIELLPTPVPILTSNGIKFNSCCCNEHPYILDSHSKLQLHQAIRTLLTSNAGNCSSNQLVAVTTYLNGHMLFECTDTCNNNDATLSSSFQVSNETCKQLMLYLADIRCRIHEQDPPTEITTSIDTKASAIPSCSYHDCVSRRIHGFLQPPPLSFLSSLDSLQDCTLCATPCKRSNHDDYIPTVWAPEVWLAQPLPGESSHDDSPKSYPEIIAMHRFRVCLYTYGHFAFLLFLNDTYDKIVDDEHCELGGFQYLFHHVHEHLSSTLNLLLPNECIDTTSNADHRIEHNTSNHLETIDQPGQTLIYVDRLTDSVFFILDSSLNKCGNRSTEYHWDTLENRPADGFRRILFNAPHRSKTEAMSDRKYQSKNVLSPPRQTIVADIDQLNDPGGRFDCRYYIASRLSSKTLLALDDTIDEISRSRQPQKASYDDDELYRTESVNMRDRSSFSYVREMCTGTSDTWIYGNTDGRKELYILLDSHFFPSIEEVQAHVTRMQKHLWDSML